LAQLPALVSSWSSQVDTNLTPGELLSLLAAALDNGQPLQIQSLPLKPVTKEFPDLRQLDPGASKPLWPQT
jgi:hypothetical protein